jgi:RNA-directed DNA polymerase
MRKRPAKDGVGQLQLQIVFPTEVATTNDGTGETEANGPEASSGSATARSIPERKERKRKWYSLYDKVTARPNLERAWKQVAANAGAAGIDRMTVARFAEGAERRLAELAEDLRTKGYRPQPVRRVYLDKSGGGKRPLGIPTVRDRIVQQALLQVLSPIFETEFSDRSHGFRPERGCATALSVVDQAVRSGYQWVVDADIEAFFDSVDHERLLTALNEAIADGSVLRLVRQILKAGVIEPGVAEVEPTELGTPQGGPLSPLLANVYLHRLDERLVAARYGLVRYADDFVIFARSQSEAEAALQLAREVLEGELGLRLHPEKTRVGSVNAGFEFLGYHYFRDPPTGQLRKEVRRKSVQRFREAVRRRTPRLKNQRRPKRRNMTVARLGKNQRLQEMVRDLNRYLRGWHWYFKEVWSAYPKTPFLRLDQFVRRRLRAAISGERGDALWNRRLPNALLRAIGLTCLDEWHERYHLGQLGAPARKGRLEGEPCTGNPYARFGRAGGRVTSP